MSKIDSQCIDNDLCIIHNLMYRIRINIGEELNLANWRIATQSPSLNLANIFSIAY